MEAYATDFPYYKHTMDKKTFRIFFKTILGRILKRVVKFLVARPPVEQLQKEITDCVAMCEQCGREHKETHESLSEFFAKAHHATLEIFPTIAPCFLLSVLSMQKIKKIVRKYGIEEQEIQKMWGNRPENIAGQMNHSIMRMVILLREICASDKELDRFVQEACDAPQDRGNEVIELISKSSDPKKQQFIQEWNAFMARFGRRGPMEIDIAKPRYQNCPALVLRMIRNIDPTGYKDEKACAEEREEAIRTVLSKLSKSHQKKVKKLLPYAQILLSYREHPKYGLISMLNGVRDHILEIGNSLKNEGKLENAEDIFFIKMEELLSAEKQPSIADSFRSLVKERKEVDKLGRSQQFPRVIFGPECIMRSISNATMQELKNLPPSMLKGLPTSPGVYEGTAVVVHNPDAEVINKGDILVARATDPGWTPLFVPAGAVAIEVGGPLTHGSVVARERGIPCVVGINGLMKKIKTGMRIRVDGEKGTVEILSTGGKAEQ